MQVLENRRGYTLIEMLTVAGVLCVIGACTISMMIGAMSSFENTAVQAQTDTDAVTAIQHVVSDLREAKSFQLLSNPTRLRLIFPITTNGGLYLRQIPDTANPAEYYLSDRSGNPANQGHYFWRSRSGQLRIVAKNIQSVQFIADSAAATRAVKITIVARNETSGAGKETRLTERVVYLRNY